MSGWDGAYLWESGLGLFSRMFIADVLTLKLGTVGTEAEFPSGPLGADSREHAMFRN